MVRIHLAAAALALGGLPANSAPSSSISCKVTVDPCRCGEGEGCANSSVAKGIRNRQDADHCCCPQDAPLIWSDPLAKCSEAKKCSFVCCPNGDKLCLNACCGKSQKCTQGVCSAAPSPTTSSTAPWPTSPPGSARDARNFWEFLPGPPWISDTALSLLGLGCVGVAGPKVARRLPALCGRRRQPRMLGATSDRPMLEDSEFVLQ